MSHTAFTPQMQNISILRPVLISQPPEGKKPSLGSLSVVCYAKLMFVSQNLPPHEKEQFEQMAREHRERNKRTLEDQRRDNCGNVISVRALLKTLADLFYFKVLPRLTQTFIRGIKL